MDRWLLSEPVEVLDEWLEGKFAWMVERMCTPVDVNRRVVDDC